METTVREPRPEKVAIVDEVKAKFDASSATFLSEYRGIAVKDLQQLRRQLRAAGAEVKVYKNTLVRRAIADGDFASIEPMLVGPTAITFVEGDVAQVAKVLREFARGNQNLIVKGGLVGRDLLDAQRAAQLADLPSREVLLAQIAGLLAQPMQRFAGLLQAVPQKFAYALKALIDQNGGVPAPAEEAPAEATAEAPAEEAPAAETAEAPADEAPAEEAPAAETAEAPADEAPAAETAEAPAEEAPAEATAEEAPAAEASDEPEAAAEASADGEN